MTNRSNFLIWLASFLGFLFFVTPVSAEDAKVRLFNVEKDRYETLESIELSEEEWQERLTKEQFLILRKEGTERAFTGSYNNHKAYGVYGCAACGTDLYHSKTKFDSGTGWPSFWEPVAEENIGTSEDFKLFYKRVEVHCARCKGHLGHIFDDGPAPTYKRHCINSVALQFKELKS